MENKITMQKSNKNLILLNTIFVISIVIANIVGCKVINLHYSLFNIPLLLSGGAITYAFTFLCTDIIGEIWGKEQANQTVKFGFIGQLFAITLIIITQYTPTDDSVMQGAYETLLGQSPMFVVGSLCAYLCSQRWDVWIFHKVRAHYKGKPHLRWIWNNVSTCTSQIIDTAIYATIAFGFGLGWFFEENGFAKVLSIIIGQYLLKLCLAIIDTPFFYLFTHKKSK